ncbi:MAG: hypothetical protein L3J07_01040 [Candidatus Magasanikbacteria bacterium]|nr:hypothetical protein [Candidatus Magasanikbacteria bacterium]
METEKKENLTENFEISSVESEDASQDAKNLADILTGKIKTSPKEYAENLINNEINEIPSGTEFTDEEKATFIRTAQSRMEQESKIFLDKVLQEEWTDEETIQKAGEILRSIEDIARKMIWEKVQKTEQISQMKEAEGVKEEINDSENIELLSKLELTNTERQQVIGNLIDQQLDLAKSSKLFKEDVLGFSGDTLPYLSDAEKTKIIGLLDATALKAKMKELERQATSPQMSDQDISIKAMEILNGSADFGKGMKELVTNKINEAVSIRQTKTTETPTVGSQPKVQTEIKGPTPIKEGVWGKIKGIFGGK